MLRRTGGQVLEGTGDEAIVRRGSDIEVNDGSATSTAGPGASAAPATCFGTRG